MNSRVLEAIIQSDLSDDCSTDLSDSAKPYS
jgi:hypothetical protein